MASENGGRGFLGKILFVVGVIIILIILAFLIIKFVPRMIGGLANVGSSIGSVFGRNELTVTASNTSLKNGDSVSITWPPVASKTGVYGITFACTDNVEVDIITEAGARSLICGNIFTLGPTATAANLRVFLKTENSFADVPIQVYFTETGSTAPAINGQVIVTVQDGNPLAASGTLSGSAATITSEEATSTSATTDTSATNTNGNTLYVNSVTTAKPKPYTTSYVTPTGPADLAISNVLASNTQVGFTVSNIGGRSTGVWAFTYTTPTNPKETFASPLQLSLAPGQSIRYTLTFAAKDSGSQSVLILVDPTNTVSESTEANNTASVTMTGAAYGNNNGGSSNNNNNYDRDDDADFVIENLEVGRMSGNRFSEDDTADEGDDIAVRFTVRNRGGDETEDWRFELRDLPYTNGDTYRSPEYDALRPGESMEIIVELDNVDEGDYDIRAEVDSEDDTDEERENNNTDAVELEVRN
jgi:hypothetical protein